MSSKDMDVVANPGGSDDTVDSRFDRAGLLVFTASLRLCYRNQRAMELCESIMRWESAKTVNGILPVAVTNLADELHRLLKIRPQSKDWEQFQVRRVVGNQEHAVLLCGFSVADVHMAQSKIVIVMQVTGSAVWHGHILDRSKKQFQLTWRETEILHHLLKGWTNKEIANALSIREQTVKEHMKHLIAKIGASTRTGIAMKAVLCGLHHETEMCEANALDPAAPVLVPAEA